jgi:peroxiredoxin
MKHLALVLALAALRTTGAALPAGTLPLLDGGSVDLQSLKGRPAVIAVYADWCDPCKADMASIVAAAKGNPRAQFLGIDALEPAPRARAFVRATGIPFRTAMLTSDEFAPLGTTDEQRAATGIDIPAVYVLDRNARVVQAFIGGDPHVGEKISKALSLVDKVTQAH